jgi:hypothetical protein
MGLHDECEWDREVYAVKTNFYRWRSWSLVGCLALDALMRLTNAREASAAEATAHREFATLQTLVEKSGKIWTTDDGWLCLFTPLEHCNAECLGHHVCKRGERFAAYEPVAPAVTRVFGAGTVDAARGVESRYDHGSQYVTDWFQS